MKGGRKEIVEESNIVEERHSKDETGEIYKVRERRRQESNIRRDERKGDKKTK